MTKLIISFSFVQLANNVFHSLKNHNYNTQSRIEVLDTLHEMNMIIDNK